MTGAVILILLAAAMAGVLAKIAVDAVGLLREERRVHGHVTPHGMLRVGVLAFIVLLVLGWLALGWIMGGQDPAVR